MSTMEKKFYHLQIYVHAAHVLFMRGDKYKEAAAFYEPIVRQNYGDILSVSAAVLGINYILSPHIQTYIC